MKRFSSRKSDSASHASSDAFADETSSVEMENDTKRKSRNLSEKKRRDQFNVLINELCSMVNYEGVNSTDTPAPDSCSDHGSSGHNSSNANKKMDKSSILRSTIDFFRLYTESKKSSDAMMETEDVEDLDGVNVKENIWKPPFLSHEEFAHLMLEALDAFILVLEADIDGQIIYASESMLSLLGCHHPRFLSRDSRLEALTTDNNTSVFDLIHDSDKSSLRRLLDIQLVDSIMDPFVSANIHFRRHNTYPPTYELVRLLGSFNSVMSKSDPNRQVCCFVAVGRVQTPKILKELIFSMTDGQPSNKEFASRHSLEWKFLFLDHRASNLIGYMPFEVLGTSGYDYYHWDDLGIVIAGHEQLMQRGEGTSSHYRFLTKGQQWIWLQTRYYITYHQWNSKPEFIVCTHTITGYDERQKSSQSDPLISECVIQAIDKKPSCSELTPTSTNNQERKNRKKRTRADSTQLISLSTRSCPTSLEGSQRDDYREEDCFAGDAISSSSRLTNDPHNPPSLCLSLPSENATNMMTDSYTTSETSFFVGDKKATSSCSSSKIVSSSQVHELLRKRHMILQQHIHQQQEELKRVEEQLLNAQFKDSNEWI